jgi:hypothetical protein
MGRPSLVSSAPGSWSSWGLTNRCRTTEHLAMSTFETWHSISAIN